MSSIWCKFYINVAKFYGIVFFFAYGCAESATPFFASDKDTCENDSFLCIGRDVYKCMNGHLFLHEECDNTCLENGVYARCYESGYEQTEDWLTNSDGETDDEFVANRNGNPNENTDTTTSISSKDESSGGRDSNSDDSDAVVKTDETTERQTDEAYPAIDSDEGEPPSEDGYLTHNTDSNDSSYNVDMGTEGKSVEGDSVSHEGGDTQIDQDTLTILDTCSVSDSGSISDTGEHYCEYYFCWQVSPTHQVSCYDNIGAVDCPPFPCDNEVSSEFCGQDAQYPEAECLFSCYADGTLLEKCDMLIDNQAEEIVLESLNGLFWSRYFPAEQTWTDANNYCDKLLLGGFDDWRLPSYLEFTSILDFGRVNPAADAQLFPWYDTTHFWTNSSLAQFPNEAGWNVNINYGNIVSVPKTDKAGALCVRGGNMKPHGSSRFQLFESDKKEWVRDQATSLEWQLGQQQNLNWLEALEYCEKEPSWGTSYREWRLPNINELTSILNYSRAYPAMDFPSTVEEEGSYWSATTVVQSEDLGYVVDLSQGYIWSLPKSNLYNVRCVRSIQ